MNNMNRYHEIVEELLNRGEDYDSAGNLAAQMVRSEEYYESLDDKNTESPIEKLNKIWTEQFEKIKLKEPWSQLYRYAVYYELISMTENYYDDKYYEHRMLCQQTINLINQGYDMLSEIFNTIIEGQLSGNPRHSYNIMSYYDLENAMENTIEELTKEREG